MNKFKLSAKISIFFGLCILIPIIIIGFVFYLQINKAIRRSYEVSKSTQTTIVSNQVNDILHDVRTDMSFISSISSLDGYINASPSSALKYKTQLQNDFLSFSKSKSIYYQVRLMDKQGQEVVRVDNKDVGVFLVPDDQLQNKSQRYYFQEGKNFPKGEMYISPIDLNIENGKFEDRGTSEVPQYVPVIRFVSPIYDRNDVFQGILVMNVDANILLDVITASYGQDTNYYLVDSNGYYIVHPDKNKEFGYLLNNPEYTFQNEFPDLYRQMKESPDHEFFEVDDNQFVYLRYISTIERDSDPITIQNVKNIWTLIEISKYNKLENEVREIVTQYIIFMISLLGFSALVGYYFIQKTFKPLKDLESATNIVSSGNLNYQVDIKTSDEIGVLAKNFNSMVLKLKAARDNTQKLIQDRTDKLTRINKLLIGRERKMAELKKKIKNSGKNHE